MGTYVSRNGGGVGAGSAIPSDALDKFTSGMTAMQAARTRQTLEKPASYRQDDGSILSGVHSEKDLVEYTIKQGNAIEQQTDVTTKVRQLKSENAPAQFAFAKREERLMERDYPAFVRGELDTPLTRYFRKGDASALGGKYAKTTYRAYSGKGERSTYWDITKTAYDYAKSIRR